jgi:hypothetical protein
VRRSDSEPYLRESTLLREHAGAVLHLLPHVHVVPRLQLLELHPAHRDGGLLQQNARIDNGRKARG